MSTGIPRQDFNAQRLFVKAPLVSGAEVILSAAQAHYLAHVLRLKAGASVLVFNGLDGEWLAEIIAVKRQSGQLLVRHQTRKPEPAPDIHYLFAPLKRARLDYMVQKATEMGAAVLQPVFTRRTMVARVRLERMRANAIEAAEQCGILYLPEIREPQKLDKLLAQWDNERLLIFCDEAAEIRSPLAALQDTAGAPVAVLVGPEGGFSPDERKALAAAPFVRAISLGQRVLRADTAAVAALALVNAVR